MILAGLWFGSSKPAMWVYLKPFHSALIRMERDGTIVESPDKPGILNIRAILLCGTCDLPAKACVCNTVQFNVSFGCFKCVQPCCTVNVVQKGGRVHAFPFNQENLKGLRRTHAEFLADAKAAISEGKAVRGVKGSCWFAGLQYYDMVKGTAVDYMHCVLKGVTKSLLNMWFSLPCEQRLHFRDMKWRAKSRLCRQPFNSVQKSGQINLKIGFLRVLDRFRSLRESCVSE